MFRQQGHRYLAKMRTATKQNSDSMLVYYVGKVPSLLDETNLIASALVSST